MAGNSRQIPQYYGKPDPEPEGLTPPPWLTLLRTQEGKMLQHREQIPLARREAEERPASRVTNCLHCDYLTASHAN